MHYRQIDVSDCDAITPREQPAQRARIMALCAQISGAAQ